MYVVAFNSSPHKDKGGTSLLLTPFCEGMKEAGADVDLFYIHTLTINPCLGCFSCWVKTPGKCIQKDDMETLLPKIAAADIMVFATPVYVDGMNGPMKTVIDRFIPLVEPFFVVENNHCRHPVRETVVPKKVVLVSVCGFTELDNFDPLITHIKAICKNLRAEFAGAVLRPYAAALPVLANMGVPVDDIVEAAHNAGYQLVQEGKMSVKTLKTVGRECVPRKEYVQGINASFKRALDAI